MAHWPKIQIPVISKYVLILHTYTIYNSDTLILTNKQTTLS